MYVRFLLLFLISFQVWAEPKTCTTLLNSISSTKSWSFEEKNLELKAEDLLPKEFVEQVEKAKGPIKTYTTFSDGRIDISIATERKLWMMVALIQDEHRPNSVIIDNLRLENPLAEEPRKNLNQEQFNKGLPASVFRHARDKIFEIAKAGGYEFAHTNSQQHYAVIMLYRKLVGMEPATPEAAQIVEKLDNYYRFSRTKLPEDVSAKSLEDFSSMLGGYNSPQSGWTHTRSTILEEYFKTGILPSDVTVYNDTDGKPMAVVFPKDDSAKSQVILIEMVEGKLEMLSWRKVNATHLLDLQKKL